MRLFYILLCSIAVSSQLHSQDSEVLSERYINFINRLGSGENVQEEASRLFTQDFKKIFNGWTVAEDRESFVADLLSIYATYGSWEIIPLDIISAQESNRIVLWVKTVSKNFGINTAIVILRYDSSGMIEEMIEVFSPVQNSYEFK